MSDEAKKATTVYRKGGNDGYIEMLPGIRRRTLLWADMTLFAEFNLDAGSKIPEHSHPEEQTGYMLSGRMTFHGPDGDFEAEPGDSWVFPGGVPHSVDVHEDAHVIEVFSPARKDYMA